MLGVLCINVLVIRKKRDFYHFKSDFRVYVALPSLRLAIRLIPPTLISRRYLFAAPFTAKSTFIGCESFSHPSWSYIIVRQLTEFYGAYMNTEQ